MNVLEVQAGHCRYEQVSGPRSVRERRHAAVARLVPRQARHVHGFVIDNDRCNWTTSQLNVVLLRNRIPDGLIDQAGDTGCGQWMGTGLLSGGVRSRCVGWLMCGVGQSRQKQKGKSENGDSRHGGALL